MVVTVMRRQIIKIRKLINLEKKQLVMILASYAAKTLQKKREEDIAFFLLGII